MFGFLSNRNLFLGAKILFIFFCRDLFCGTKMAEYMATAGACRETAWLKGLYAELCGDDSCINLFCDNQSAIYLTKD
jgi:hypothetical protein